MNAWNNNGVDQQIFHFSIFFDFKTDLHMHSNNNSNSSNSNSNANDAP
jgi:hypothetical protein